MEWTGGGDKECITVRRDLSMLNGLEGKESPMRW
jgi:hypothetical protein